MQGLPHVLVIFALLAATPACAQDARGLGRLFFTPEQRQALDKHRNLNTVSNAEGGSGFITLNGRVQRSTGKTTTWIDGQIADESRINSNELRVGDRLDTTSGARSELLNGGQIRVSPHRTR